MNPKLNYSEQLKHPNWQRRRLEMLNAADFKCTACGSDDETLHVHHKYYKKNVQVWEYTDNELIVLCANCHSLEHERQDIVNNIVRSIPFSSRNQFTALMAGISYMYSGDDIIDKTCRDGLDQILVMAGIAAVSMRYMDLSGMDSLSKFLNEEIKKSHTRINERIKLNHKRGLS